MKKPPSISIVVPSFNQAKFIGETLDSLVAQDYTRLEVIIQDGGSTDGAVAIAQDYVRRYPAIFQLFVEKDAGQADALNRGFARTTGEILGFLNSDDTLYPGCLQRVAREIDPARDRYVVFGRCLFTGEGSPYVGVEHPAVYRSHFDHLAIWQRGFNTIPQPSVFWHRQVWQKRGGFNIREQHVLDYDLFCRFSTEYRFHFVDELWSTYRMHAASKSSQRTETEILDLSIAVSRRYWGGWWLPLRWRCELSHWLHDRHLHEHARHHARAAEAAGRAGRSWEAFVEFLRTTAYSPRMARDRLLRGWLAQHKLGFLESLLESADTFTGQHADTWIGPLYRVTVPRPANAKKLVISLYHQPQGYHQKIKSTLWVNGRKCSTARHEAPASFTLEADVSGQRQPFCNIEIRTQGFFIPQEVHGTPDPRHLAVQLVDTKFECYT